MPSSGGVTKYLSAWGPTSPSFWNQRFLALRPYELVPSGEKRRLQIEGLFHGPHLVNALLSVPAIDHSAAPATVIALRALTCSPPSLTAEGTRVPPLRGRTLSDGLDDRVEQFANAVEREAGAPQPVEAALKTLRRIRQGLFAAALKDPTRRTEMCFDELEISLTPLEATVEWYPSPGGFAGRIDHYRAVGGPSVGPLPPPRGPGFRTRTVIAGKMFELAGALLSDTRYRLRQLSQKSAGADPTTPALSDQPTCSDVIADNCQ
jgi:hypothetical protein